MVIGMSIMVFHNPITRWNLFGMMLALSGVMIYNTATLNETKSTNETDLVTTERV
jgi:drug/metabolite transporter (DMT)-like permease